MDWSLLPDDRQVGSQQHGLDRISILFSDDQPQEPEALVSDQLGFCDCSNISYGRVSGRAVVLVYYKVLHGTAQL